ncbi:MAG: MerR family transcriptional regulator [Thiotrichales bacterium]|nr:MerR family transcriptional regulator [Thiotrichales bacterium]
MNDTYTIGELSREFAVTTRTIRFYEDEGLLSPGRKGRNRVYAPRDRTRLKLILRGKRLGFSLGEVKHLLDLYDGPGGEASQLELFLRKIDEHRTALLEQRGEIDAVLDEMKSLEQRCYQILDTQ